jgi:hypothetical protein
MMATTELETAVRFPCDGETRTQAELIEGAVRWCHDVPTRVLRWILGGVVETWRQSDG